MRSADNSFVCRFQGERGQFSVLEGELEPAVLLWLREQFATIDSGDWSFVSNPALHDRKVENDCKLEIVGQLHSSKRTQQQLFSMQAGKPHFDRWRAWREAFLTRNQEGIGQIEAQVRDALRLLSPEDLGLNGACFLSTPIANCFFAFGCLQIMRGEPAG